MDVLRLRGHHLICLHFFRGEGYDRPFIENLSAIIGMAEGGKPVAVLEGPDDVCSACPYLKSAGCEYEENAEGSIRDMDADALRLLRARFGDVVMWPALRERLEGIVPEWKKLYCKDCAWLNACLKDPLYKSISLPAARHRVL